MENKKLLKYGAIGMSLVSAVGSLSYFTDRADTNASATAGTVKIELGDYNINLFDENGYDILNPGDMRSFNFFVINTGNKSIDVRTTIKLTSTVPMTTDANGQAEYEIYNKADVELVAGQGYKPKASAKPIQVRTMAADGLSITYQVPDYILSGNSDLYEEVETEPDAHKETDGINTVDYGYIYDYVLVFRGDSENKFQDSTVKLDILAEAKQHRNTSAGWNIVAQQSYTTTGGTITKDSVYKRTENSRPPSGGNN